MNYSIFKYNGMLIFFIFFESNCAKCVGFFDCIIFFSILVGLRSSMYTVFLPNALIWRLRMQNCSSVF